MTQQPDPLVQWVKQFQRRCKELPPEPRYPLHIVRAGYKQGFFRRADRDKRLRIINETIGDRNV